MNRLRRHLIDQGYCVVPQVIPAGLLAGLRSCAAETMRSDPAAYAISKPMGLTYHVPVIRELISDSYLLSPSCFV